LRNRREQFIRNTFKSYLAGILISLSSDYCPTLVSVFSEGSLELSMVNPWVFLSYLDHCGSGQDYGVGTLLVGFKVVRVVSFAPN
jgi:hypothetical protein